MKTVAKNYYSFGTSTTLQQQTEHCHQQLLSKPGSDFTNYINKNYLTVCTGESKPQGSQLSGMDTELPTLNSGSNPSQSLNWMYMLHLVLSGAEKLFVKVITTY